MTRPEPERPDRSRFARWRAGSLLLVHVLIALHITHWLVARRTLAPLELNEVMYTLELGIVTAGFVFMAIAVVASAIFGRFFCSWACHVLALQDLAAFVLRKLSVRPRPVRSRLLLWVPVLAMLSMFVWPQLERCMAARPLPILRLASDADGWASFVTTNFWRNLPGPMIAVGTLLVCGGLIIYILGTRSFCRYGCPYGAVFALADRIAPGRVRARAACVDCGICTAACDSGVRVHEEIARYGMVVSPACLKDLDCVAVCPDQSLHFGFGWPPFASTVRHDVQVHRRYDFTLVEEVAMASVFIVTLLVFRGLYDLVPFLLSMGIALIVAYLAVVLARLCYRRDVRLASVSLKLQGRLSPHGIAFIGGMLVLAAFETHSGAIRYHSVLGLAALERSRADQHADDALVQPAIDHLAFAQRHGLLTSARVARGLFELHTQVAQRLLQRGLFARAIPHLGDAVQLEPSSGEVRCELGAALLEVGDVGGALVQLGIATRLLPSVAAAHHDFALALAQAGRLEQALHEIDRAASLDPADVEIRAVREQLRSRVGKARR